MSGTRHQATETLREKVPAAVKVKPEACFTGLDGYGVWRKLRPGKRSIDRLVKVLRYGVQRGYWLDWRITLYDEVKQ